MNEVLSQSLEPVLRDIRSSGVPMPIIRDEDWADGRDVASAMLCSPDGSVIGIRVDTTALEQDRMMQVADQVQEWVIEELWSVAAAANWPQCPNHPDGHPLTASTRGGRAVWVCPSDGMPFSPVGSLA